MKQHALALSLLVFSSTACGRSTPAPSNLQNATAPQSASTPVMAVEPGCPNPIHLEPQTGETAFASFAEGFPAADDSTKYQLISTQVYQQYESAPGEKPITIHFRSSDNYFEYGISRYDYETSRIDVNASVVCKVAPDTGSFPIRFEAETNFANAIQSGRTQIDRLSRFTLEGSQLTSHVDFLLRPSHVVASSASTQGVLVQLPSGEKEIRVHYSEQTATGGNVRVFASGRYAPVRN